MGRGVTVRHGQSKAYGKAYAKSVDDEKGAGNIMIGMSTSFPL